MRSGVLLFCLLSSLVCHAAGGRALVRLCERAGVAAETVRLSDFLPPEGAAIREQAAAIELGRSPLLGSSRYFTRQQVEQALRNHADLTQRISVPDRITAFAAGWPISADIVQGAISKYAGSRGSGLDGSFSGPLTLLGSPVASQPMPDLKIDKVERDVFRDEIRFSVGCVQRNVCGIFLATMRQANGFFRQLPGGALPRARISSAVSKQLLVRAGMPAMLNLRNDSMDISLPVICLDRGSLGQIIRVRDASGRKIFRAKVIGAAQVQASL